MRILVLTPVRLLGDGLLSCFSKRPDVRVVASVSDLHEVRQSLTMTPALDAVLVDVTQGVDFYDVRPIAAEWPDVKLIALGLHEQRQEVIQCGRAGFAGYIPRDATIETLCNSLSQIVAGHLPCPSEISGGLLRALFAEDSRTDIPVANSPLTRRESEVLQCLGRGLSNKEIAMELCLSVATVKHHVHHILEKLQFQRRAQAMRRVRDAPWIAPLAAKRHARL
jgi:two-component system, NarL family, nitrate/nitrite response regulator NarL